MREAPPAGPRPDGTPGPAGTVRRSARGGGGEPPHTTAPLHPGEAS